jgi:hypothetical protein
MSFKKQFAFFIACAALFVSFQQAEAVRPFVTDDARIVDRGQIEIEMWLDAHVHDGIARPSFNVVLGFSPLEWLQFLFGGGIGLDSANGFQAGIANPTVQAKFLFTRIGEGITQPGFSLVLGGVLPVGLGYLKEEAGGFFLIAPITFRFFGEWLLIHINVGLTGGFYLDHTKPIDIRPFWGIGFDVGLGLQQLRLIGEAYAGDPFEIEKPFIAAQLGFRWLVNDHVNIDLTFGTQPYIHASATTWPVEFWGQLGVRLLFDAFTGGRKGDPEGARGMTQWKTSHPAHPKK